MLWDHLGSRESLNPQVPEPLLRLSVPDPRLCWLARLWKGMPPWDTCSQHKDVPKDSQSVVSFVPFDL